MWWDTDIGFESGLGSGGRSMGAPAMMFGAQMLGSFMADRTNRKEMDFAERMSSTSWQRGIEDMKKAGINPIVAFSKGGASAPIANLDNPAEGITQNVGSAIQLMNQTKLINAQVDLMAAQGAQARAGAAATGAQALRDSEAWEGSGRELHGKRALDMWDQQMSELESRTASNTAKADLDAVDKALKDLQLSGAEWTASQYKVLTDAIESLPSFMQAPVKMMLFILGQTGVVPGLTYMMGKGMGKGSANKPEVSGGTPGFNPPVIKKRGVSDGSRSRVVD